MKYIGARSFPLVVSGIVALIVAAVSESSEAGKDAWKAEMIADALQAAPPSVTDDAKVFGWSSDGELTLIRYGTGPYVCVASGAFSVRVGKPPMPYPDPMCLDQNAWTQLQALWSGPSPGDTGKRLPSSPGLVWMLGGMNINKEAVDIGAEEIAVSHVMADQDSGEVIQMTPHVMIMPLPFDERAADLTSSYRLDDPFGAWIMAAGKPHEHLMVHFSARDTAALVNVDNQQPLVQDIVFTGAGNLVVAEADNQPAQQIVEAFPFDTAPRYLLRDRDSIHGEQFRKRVKSLGIEVILTPRDRLGNHCMSSD